MLTVGPHLDHNLCYVASVTDRRSRPVVVFKAHCASAYKGMVMCRRWHGRSAGMRVYICCWGCCAPAKAIRRLQLMPMLLPSVSPWYDKSLALWPMSQPIVRLQAANSCLEGAFISANSCVHMSPMCVHSWVLPHACNTLHVFIRLCGN